MKIPTLFLRGVIFLLGLVVLGLCIFAIVTIAREGATADKGFALIQYPVSFVLIGSTGAFLTALYQALSLLKLIDKNKAFSQKSVKALRSIKGCGYSIAALYVLIMPIIFYVAELDDAPGLAGMGLIIILASVVVATFAAVLEKLLQNVLEIKKENELTV